MKELETVKKDLSENNRKMERNISSFGRKRDSSRAGSETRETFSRINGTVIIVRVGSEDVNDNICDRIVEFRIDELGLEENDAEENQNEENRISKKEEIIVWNKETIESYNKNTEVINDEEDMDKDCIQQCREKKTKKKKKCIGYTDGDIIKDKENRVSNYLKVENMEWKRGDEIKALFKLRCGNLEEKNKYWLGIEEGGCLFYASENNLEHCVKECEETGGSFEELGKELKRIVGIYEEKI
ncbi:hypothetical protein ALC53_13717 [Atta colombica]|uniref:Uncharacterized protein n=1 Tax=Atta colombica TaxID=520822 RepID=A0A195AUJ6_9HYME|nr:hypothetical protein ALC53_13717 [Atta colombica]